MTNHLPKEIEQLSFTLTYLGESLKVTLEKGNIACVLQTDSLLSVEEMDGGIRIRQK